LVAHGNQAAPPPGPAVDARGIPAADPSANVIALADAGFRRQDDLRNAHGKGVRREMRLHVKYQAKLAKAESARIDAIRAVDVAAVATAAAAAEQRASALATQVLALAETLRNTVATTAATGELNFRTALEPMQTDIRALRDAQNSFVGRTTASVSDTAEQTAQQGVRRDNFQWAIGLAALLAVALIGFLAAHYH
jgi:hypothetical protein